MRTQCIQRIFYCTRLCRHRKRVQDAAERLLVSLEAAVVGRRHREQVQLPVGRVGGNQVVRIRLIAVIELLVFGQRLGGDQGASVAGLSEAVALPKGAYQLLERVQRLLRRAGVRERVAADCARGSVSPATRAAELLSC